MCLSAGTDSWHLPGQSWLSTNSIPTHILTHTHWYTQTLRDTHRHQTREILWSTLGTLLRWLRSGLRKTGCQCCHCFACQPCNREKEPVWGPGDWSSSQDLTQSCLLAQRCGSGTLHRWKTEEGEWVIMRVLAPFCPHEIKKHNPQLWPSYQLVVCGFLRLSSQSFSDEKHRLGRRGVKKTGVVPTEFTRLEV